MYPLENPLRTRPIQMCREMSVELDPNRQFGFINDPDRQFGACSVLTSTLTGSDGPELLQKTVMVYYGNGGEGAGERKVRKSSYIYQKLVK
jgi:hypothetical protein